MHYRDLQALVHEQETRNLTLHEAQPSAVLNFEFLVRERSCKPDNARTKSAENVLIFNLSKVKNMCTLRNICLERFNTENVYDTKIKRVKVYHLKVPSIVL